MKGLWRWDDFGIKISVNPVDVKIESEKISILVGLEEDFDEISLKKVSKEAVFVIILLKG